jgi:hypothetical protein
MRILAERPSAPPEAPHVAADPGFKTEPRALDNAVEGDIGGRSRNGERLGVGVT